MKFASRHPDAMIFVIATVLTVSTAMLVWLSMDVVAFAGADGKGFLARIKGLIAFAPPFDYHTFNPLQGVFGQQRPINVWGNPGYWPFLITDDEYIAVLFSQCISAATLIAVSYCMARSFGVAALPAIIGSQCVIFAFSPFLLTFGLPSQFSLVPPTAITIALTTFAVCTPFLLRPDNQRKFVAVVMLVTIVLAYALYADPLYFPAAALSMAPLAIVLLANTGGVKSALTVLACFCLAILLLWLTGFVDYATTLMSANARVYFTPENSRPQLPDFGMSILTMPDRALMTYCMMIGGWLMLAIFGRNGRSLAYMAFLQFGLLVAYSIVFLFTPINLGNAPAPMYFEQNSSHLFLCAAGVGYTMALNRFLRLKDRHKLQVSVVVIAIPLLILIYRADMNDFIRQRYSEPWPNDQLSKHFERSIALHTGGIFRGTVLFARPGAGNSYQSTLSYVNLWKNGIPTANEYSHLHSIPLYYLTSRSMLSERGKPGLNTLTVEFPNASILASMGVRYLVLGRQEIFPDFKYIDRYDGWQGNRQYFWYLYENRAPNIGDYSPTEVVVTATASDTINLLSNPGFDFRKRVVLHESLAKPLLPVLKSSLVVERGRLHVRAESEGTSLLVLPVQYSRCWSIRSNNPVKMLRADFLLTGLVFDKQLDADMTLDFGFMNSSCRRQDVTDMKSLGVVPGVPRADESVMRPYQAKNWHELMINAQRLLLETNKRRLTQCAQSPPAGSVSQWLQLHGLPPLRFSFCI